jgi:hypothetical protein
MICQQCAITVHSDHLTECQPIERPILDKYIETAISELLDYRERVQALIGTCIRLRETDISVTSQEFLSLSKII